MPIQINLLYYVPVVIVGIFVTDVILRVRRVRGLNEYRPSEDFVGVLMAWVFLPITIIGFAFYGFVRAWAGASSWLVRRLTYIDRVKRELGGGR